MMCACVCQPNQLDVNKLHNSCPLYGSWMREVHLQIYDHFRTGTPAPVNGVHPVTLRRSMNFIILKGIFYYYIYYL